MCLIFILERNTVELYCTFKIKNTLVTRNSPIQTQVFCRPRRSRSRSRSDRRYKSSRYSRSRSRSAGGYGGSRRSHSHSPMSSRRRHMGTRDNPKPSRCLGVFGLSVYTTEEELYHIFSKYGPVERVQVVIDAKVNQIKMFIVPVTFGKFWFS